MWRTLWKFGLKGQIIRWVIWQRTWYKIKLVELTKTCS